MPKASLRLICSFWKCRKRYKATRRDSKYCSQHCRNLDKHENLKFKFHGVDIPKSGVPGITFNKFHQKWEIKVKIDGKWDYKGSEKELKNAIKFQKEILDK